MNITPMLASKVRGVSMRPILVVAVSILAACATGFHPRGMTGGYEERQRAPDLFDVGFFGNGSIAIGVVRDYARLRASQVAIEHGFNYFLIEGEVADMEITLSGSHRPFCVIAIKCFVDKPEGTSFKSTEVRDALQQQYEISADMKPPPKQGGQRTAVLVHCNQRML